MSNRHHVVGGGPADREEFSSWLAKLRAERAALVASVPCGLTKSDLCTDPDGCRLRETQDCPREREQEARDAANLRRVAEIKQLPTTAADRGIPNDHWWLLGISDTKVHPRFRKTTALVTAEASTHDLLVLCGGTGVGKSGAAAIWVWKRGGIWRTAEEIQALDRYDRPNWNAVRGAAALVIDELGTELDDEKGHWRNRLDNIVTWRYDHRLPTCLTSNLLLLPTRTLLGARICSRLDNVQRGRLVPCFGEDLRQCDAEQAVLPLEGEKR
jgi:DNA replication protein DnaC